MAVPDDLGTRSSSDTVLILLALAGAATPIAVALFARDRLWHEGVDGFLVAVVCSVLVARSGRNGWQQQLAKTLLVLGAVVVVVVIALVVFLFAAISKNGFTG